MCNTQAAAAWFDCLIPHREAPCRIHNEDYIKPWQRQQFMFFQDDSYETYDEDREEREREYHARFEQQTPPMRDLQSVRKVLTIDCNDPLEKDITVADCTGLLLKLAVQSQFLDVWKVSDNRLIVRYSTHHCSYSEHAHAKLVIVLTKQASAGKFVGYMTQQNENLNRNYREGFASMGMLEESFCAWNLYGREAYSRMREQYVACLKGMYEKMFCRMFSFQGISEEACVRVGEYYADLKQRPSAPNLFLDLDELYEAIEFCRNETYVPGRGRTLGKVDVEFRTKGRVLEHYHKEDRMETFLKILLAEKYAMQPDKYEVHLVRCSDFTARHGDNVYEITAFGIRHLGCEHCQDVMTLLAPCDMQEGNWKWRIHEQHDLEPDQYAAWENPDKVYVQKGASIMLRNVVFKHAVETQYCKVKGFWRKYGRGMCQMMGKRMKKIGFESKFY